MSGDPNLSLVLEAKRCRYTLIPKNISDEEVLQIWLHVSQFIIRQLIQQKAVNISGLGMFSVLKRQLDLGNNGMLCVQRPIFILSEKFAKTHNVTFTKYLSAGEIPVVQLNYAVISLDIGYKRETVEICIKEVIGTFARMLNSRKVAELTFRDIGRLVCKEGKAKMKFSKDFIRTLDGSRSILLNPLNLLRPQTTDSFISRSSVMSSSGSFRPNTFVLPSAGSRNAWINPKGAAYDVLERPPSVISSHSGSLTLSPLDSLAEDPEKDSTNDRCNFKETLSPPPVLPLPRCGPTTPVSPPSSSGWGSELLACDGGMEVPLQLDQLHKKIKTDLKPSMLKLDEDSSEGDADKPAETVVTFDPTVEIARTSPQEEDTNTEGCSHRSGQELCYLCHQRQRRNVPISFTEEKMRSELEQDRVLQQYQQLKDQSFYEKERRYINREREICKEVAQCNLVTSEKIKLDKVPGNEFHHSYIFNRRCPSPQRFLTQDQYSNELGDQVRVKTERLKKLKDGTDQLEQNEQRCLANELGEARKRYLESKAAATKQYQSALFTQVKNKPFRFPKAEPDSDGPIFGSTDITPEKVSEMRKRSKEVLNHQLRTIKEKKNKSQRDKDDHRRYETEILSRTKMELKEDSYKRFQITNGIRKELEKSWTEQHTEKQRRDLLDKKHQMKSGITSLPGIRFRLPASTGLPI